MSLNTFFATLLPKEDKFFPQYQAMGERIVTAADYFTEMVSTNDHDKRVELYTKIKSLETECDHIIIQIFEELNDSFVAPFDREDMHQLGDDMDDVMDYINDSAKRILLYQPKSMPNKTIHMAEIILEGAKAICTALGELKTINKKPAIALDQCAKLHDLEHEGDDVYDNFVKELFENEEDTKELIKIKEIMASMEDATDRANHVGKTLKTIIVKYA
ncbi:MAG: DUF47 family protein [Paludibacteraceae bacterium]|nr:DUF47 family protein [Paludibacteraceae bacterium]